MKDNFGNKLNTLRKARNLTSQELAKLAKVSQPLISGLVNNYRVIGEYTARKIGTALKLQDLELEDFIYLAINECSEKTLEMSKKYPAELINLVTNELDALAIEPDNIMQCVLHPSADTNAALFLTNGKTATIRVEVAIR